MTQEMTTVAICFGIGALVYFVIKIIHLELRKMIQARKDNNDESNNKGLYELASAETMGIDNPGLQWRRHFDCPHFCNPWIG